MPAIKRRSVREAPISLEKIAGVILIIRGQKVLMDSDLAVLYGVETKVLNRAVRRNTGRFPEDFMFQLNESEVAALKRQNDTSSLRFQIGASKQGGRRYRPYVFTGQGVAMLSSVLRSKKAVQVNVEIMRTFVRLRQMLASNTELARKLSNLEKKYDAQFKAVFEAIRELMAPPPVKRRPIGFGPWE